ncbi:ATP synthase F1 subunit epsilon [Buchnera aphidicola (Takecallis taiwana)]
MDCFLNVISIKQHLFSGAIQKIHITGYQGVLNIYPGHAPLLTMIRAGLLSIFTNDNTQYLYVSRGILEVQPFVIYVLPDEGCFLSDLKYDELIYQKKQLSKSILQVKDSEKKILQRQLLDIVLKIKLINNYCNIS